MGLHLHQSPQDWPRTAIFTSADGSSCEIPCLLGIRAGETRFTTALDILRAHPLLKNAILSSTSYSGSGMTKFTAGQISASVVPGRDGRVYAIQVGWSQRPGSVMEDKSPPLIGDLFVKLGTPAWVSLDEIHCVGLTSFHYDYNGRAMRIATDYQPALDPTNPVRYVVISVRPLASVGAKVAWQGLSHTRRYGLKEACG